MREKSGKLKRNEEKKSLANSPAHGAAVNMQAAGVPRLAWRIEPGIHRSPAGLCAAAYCAHRSGGPMPPADLMPSRQLINMRTT